MARVSHKLKMAALTKRVEGTRLYQIAQAAQLHPTTLSSLLLDIRPVRDDDPRVIAIGKVLGIEPADCFESERKR